MVKFKTKELIAALRERLPVLAEQLEGDFDEDVPVSTGALRDSLAISSGETKVVLSYSAPYAVSIHEGFSRSDGSSTKARRWTARGVERISGEGSVPIFSKALEGLK